MKLSTTFTMKLNAFNEALNGARQSLQMAGKLLVEMVQENDQTYEIILSNNKNLDLTFLEALERVGQGTLHPLLLENPSPAAIRAISNNLSMSEQKQLMEGVIPIVCINGDSTKIEQKRLNEIKSHEAVRAIGDGKIRTVQEQTVILKEQIARRESRKFRFQLDPDNGRVTFFAEVTMSWSDLMEIADKIKPQAKDIEDAIKKRQI